MDPFLKKTQMKDMEDDDDIEAVFHGCRRGLAEESHGTFIIGSKVENISNSSESLLRDLNER